MCKVFQVCNINILWEDFSLKRREGQGSTERLPTIPATGHPPRMLSSFPHERKEMDRPLDNPWGWGWWRTTPQKVHGRELCGDAAWRGGERGESKTKKTHIVKDSAVQAFLKPDLRAPEVPFMPGGGASELFLEGAGGVPRIDPFLTPAPGSPRAVPEDEAPR